MLLLIVLFKEIQSSVWETIFKMSLQPSICDPGRAGILGVFDGSIYLGGGKRRFGRSNNDTVPYHCCLTGLRVQLSGALLEHLLLRRYLLVYTVDL